MRSSGPPARPSRTTALKGFFDAEPARRHLVTSRLEHKAILDTACHLEHLGVAVTRLSPDAAGEISGRRRRGTARGHRHRLLMLVNNEIGTLTDVAEIARAVHAAGALLHVDAAQAVGKTGIDVKAMGIDLLSMSAHKFYGPKGIGALYVNRHIAPRIACQMHGGGHEQGLRSGTLATHQIVAMGTACELARAEMASDNRRIAQWRERLLDGVRALGSSPRTPAAPADSAHGQPDRGAARLLPSMLGDDRHLFHLSLQLGGRQAVPRADRDRPDADAAARTVRLSLGRFTTQDDVDFAVACFRRAIERCREAEESGQTLQVKQLSDEVGVSAQLSGTDVRAAHAIGFRSIVCNRPDGEAAGQTPFAQIAEVAGALGMTVRYLPVESGRVTDEAAAAFRALVAGLPKPVLAYCRTGTRAEMLWNSAGMQGR